MNVYVYTRLGKQLQCSYIQEMLIGKENYYLSHLFPPPEAPWRHMRHDAFAATTWPVYETTPAEDEMVIKLL